MQNKEKASVRLRSIAFGKKPSNLLYSISASVITTFSFFNRTLLVPCFQHYKKLEFCLCTPITRYFVYLHSVSVGSLSYLLLSAFLSNTSATSKIPRQGQEILSPENPQFPTHIKIYPTDYKQ